MSDEPVQTQSERTAPEAAALLERVLNAVQERRRKEWVEITTALVLSLAALASAWCAYQASRWGGVQTFRLAAASKADRAAMEHQIAGLHYRTFDASIFISYLQSANTGDKKFEELLRKRFRPEMKVAMEAWLKTEPLTNPHAPISPFKMSEYMLKEDVEAKSLSETSHSEFRLAHQASDTSDTYVMLTVLLAMVLLFGGIAGTFESRWLRQTLTIIATILFVFTTAFLWTMPFCRE
jgi:hypothetical protein